MTAQIHTLPSRMPTAALSDQMAAALAMRHAIDTIQKIAAMPADQVAALAPDTLDSMASCLSLLAHRVRLLREMAAMGRKG